MKLRVVFAALRRASVGLTIAAGLVLGTEASAAPLTTQDYFANPKYLGVAYSPNGKLLAALAPGPNGRENLFVIDLDNKSGKLLTGYTTYDVVSFHWINDHRLVYSLGSLGEVTGWTAQNGGGLYAVNTDGTYSRQLYDLVIDAEHQGKRFRPGWYFANLPETDTEDVLVLSMERSSTSADVYRVNTLSGKRTLLTYENPGDVAQWVLDHNGIPRVAISESKTLDRIVYYRESADAPWQEIERTRPIGPHMTPIAFDQQNKNLIVSSNHESNTEQLYRYDPRTKTFLEKIYGRTDVDVDTPILDPVDHHLLGVHFDAEKPGVVWYDERMKAVQRTVDGALPKTFNRLILVRRDPNKILIVSYSDRQGAVWYSYDIAKRQIEELVSALPKFSEENTVEMKPVTYKARDGMDIPAYLFIPAGVDPKNLPLIVNVHGGPRVRADEWRLSLWGPLESQFLAAHGYAVLLPNFRGTPGFGRKLYEAGLRDWGKEMQDDLEDGARWLASQGTVDLNRVCIYGASYGGYAALEGLVKTPDLYRCGVGSLAVTDVGLLMTSSQEDFAYNDTAIADAAFWIGDPKADKAALEAISPAFHADRIKANVLLISGGDDYRVPLEHGQEMKDALVKAGKKPEWIIMSGESHGFGKIENRVTEYDAMLRFFDENLKPKPQ